MGDNSERGTEIITIFCKKNCRKRGQLQDLFCPPPPLPKRTCFFLHCEVLYSNAYFVNWGHKHWHTGMGGGRIDGVKIGCEGFEVPVEVWPLTTEPSDLQVQYFNISSNLELFVAKLKSKGYLFHFSMFFLLSMIR